MVTGAGAGGTSRRGLIAAAVTAVGGALIAGCGSTVVAASHPAIPTRAPRGAGARRSDVRILTAALAMERQAIAAYAACIPLLRDSEARWAQAFVVEEIQQAGALAKLITLAGATAAGENGEPAIGHPRDGAQATALLAELETEHITRYLGWIPQLTVGTLRAGVASILASDAQHVTALHHALGRPALRSAFVSGAASTAGVTSAAGVGTGTTTGTGTGTTTTSADDGDRNALRPLLAAQQLSLACESRVTALLAGQPASTRTLIGRVHEQEQAHVTATSAVLRRLGARPLPPPASDAAIDAVLARHLIPGRPGHLRGAGDALALLVDVERAAIGAAYVALAQIHDGRLAVLVAQMMASDAQHEALLDEAHHPGAVAAAIPYGVVEGIA